MFARTPASPPCSCPLRLSPSGKTVDPEAPLLASPVCDRDSTRRFHGARFPASGSSGESFAPGDVAMDDPGRWQRALLQECRQTRPGVGALTIPSRQPSLPDPHNLVGIPEYPSTVSRHAIIGVVAPHHRRKVGMLDGDRPMPVIPAPVRHPRQRSGIAALGRDRPDHVDPFARLAPDMGEARKSNVVPFAAGWWVPSGRLKRKSMRRVLSGWSVSPYRARRLPRTARTRVASGPSSRTPAFSHLSI